MTRWPLGLLLVLLITATPGDAADAGRLTVGVTLHPYYSWTKNIAGDADVEVRPVIPGEIDAGDYQPSPEDIKKLADLDAIVVNGVGHDDFIFDMIKASGNEKITIIRPNDAVPLMRAAHGGGVNSHTFISFTNAIQQTYAIAQALATLRPALAPAFQQNAADYARRLRAIKARAARALADAKVTRVVTVHDGYAYLMQEFGIEIAGVVEPAHGLIPSAAELERMVDLIKRERIRVVFSEETFPEPLLNVLRESTGARVYLISHVARGAYAADEFEREMQRNVDVMVRALVQDPNGGRGTVSGGDPPLLEIVDLTVRRERELLLDRVSLALAPGSITVVVGPNGAGKSTLLAAVLGQIEFAGRIRFHWRGKRAHRLRPASVSWSIARCRSRRANSSPSRASGARSASGSPRRRALASRRCSPAPVSPGWRPVRSACSRAARPSGSSSPTPWSRCRSCSSSTSPRPAWTSARCGVSRSACSPRETSRGSRC